MNPLVLILLTPLSGALLPHIGPTLAVDIFILPTPQIVKMHLVDARHPRSFSSSCIPQVPSSTNVYSCMLPIPSGGMHVLSITVLASDGTSSSDLTFTVKASQ